MTLSFSRCGVRRVLGVRLALPIGLSTTSPTAGTRESILRLVEPWRCVQLSDALRAKGLIDYARPDLVELIRTHTRFVPGKGNVVDISLPALSPLSSRARRSSSFRMRPLLDRGTLGGRT